MTAVEARPDTAVDTRVDTAPHTDVGTVARDDRHPILVVGVDGSAASARALAWAADYAESHRGRLRIVTAFTHPHAGVDVPLSYLDLYRDANEAARTNAERVLSAQLGDDRSLVIEHVVAPGSIDRVVNQHIADAAMVVLGTQSRRRWRDRLRSSATNRITGHITVPVISVPADT